MVGWSSQRAILIPPRLFMGLPPMLLEQSRKQQKRLSLFLSLRSFRSFIKRAIKVRKLCCGPGMRTDRCAWLRQRSMYIVNENALIEPVSVSEPAGQFSLHWHILSKKEIAVLFFYRKGTIQLIGRAQAREVQVAESNLFPFPIGTPRLVYQTKQYMLCCIQKKPTITNESS